MVRTFQYKIMFQYLSITYCKISNKFTCIYPTKKLFSLKMSTFLVENNKKNEFKKLKSKFNVMNFLVGCRFVIIQRFHMKFASDWNNFQFYVGKHHKLKSYWLKHLWSNCFMQIEKYHDDTKNISFFLSVMSIINFLKRSMCSIYNVCYADILEWFLFFKKKMPGSFVLVIVCTLMFVIICNWKYICKVYFYDYLIS